MSKPLRPRPDLDQLRRQAKELRRAVRAGQADALGRIRVHLALRSADRLTLSGAQFVIAREHGFASWPTLVSEVQARTMSLVQRLAELVTVSVRDDLTRPTSHGPRARALRLLDEDPHIGRYDIRVAAVLGEAAHVERMLARDPDLATRPDERTGWPPLLFACGSRWHHLDPRRAAGLVQVARLLLDAGADPNSTTATDHRPSCSALYAAAGLANHPALAALLLERGADPDTRSALYHAAFHPDQLCLRLLLDHGARREGTVALGAAISVANTETVRLLVDAGVSVREPIPGDALGETADDAPPVRAALEFRCPPELIELLLNHGADPVGPVSYQLATRNGDVRAAQALRLHGALDDLAPVDRLLGACARGDREAALAAPPDLLAELSEDDLGALVDAAEHLGPGPVALMLDLGFPTSTRRRCDGATALHAAAYAGRPDVVRLLIDHGADIEARDHRFQSTPLSWAMVGSGQPPRDRPGDWVATVELLFDAGTRADGGWTAAKPPSDPVAEVLLAHGIGPEDD